METIKQITLDINKDIYQTIDAKQNDANSRFIQFTLIDNGVSCDLTGNTVKIFADKADGTIIFNNVTITDAINGVVTVELTSQALAVVGDLVCELVIYGSNSSVLSSKIFIINVTQSIRNDSAIESQNEFTALTEALGTVSTIENKADKSYVDSNLSTVNSALADIVKLSDGTQFQTFLDNIQDNANIKVKSTTITVDNVFTLQNKNNVILDFSNTKFVQNKHGYGVLEISNCSNIRIKGGIIQGAGNFPAQTIDNTNKVMHNEKVDCPNDWGTYKNGAYTSGGVYNGGYLYNVSFGILIIEGCSNVIIEEVESSGFNYIGIGIGFRGKIDGTINKNITIKNCYSHDNFCGGIHVMHVDGFEIYNNKCENNGHPSALVTDYDCNPGYGITCRNSTSIPKNGSIYNNTCCNNKRKGIDAHSGQYITISYNKIYNNFAYGIALSRFNGFISDFTIDNNTIISCGNIPGGIAIRCESYGYNIISNNKIIDSGLSGCTISLYNGIANILDNIINGCSINNGAIAIDIQDSDVIFKGNTIYNSGVGKCLRVYLNKYANIENNIFNYNNSANAIYLNIHDGFGVDGVINVLNNVFITNPINSDLTANNIPNGVISNNKFTGSVITTTTCGFVINNTNINYNSASKITTRETINSITTVTVTITNGVITYSDSNNIVTGVVDQEKGFTIQLGSRIPNGCSYMKKTTGTTEVTGVVARDINANSLNIALLTASNPNYGQASTTITNFCGIFTINVK